MEPEFQSRPPQYPPIVPDAPQSTPGHQGYAGRGGTASIGIALIVLGVLFLGARLIPGIAWWTWWPAVIIAGGFVTMITPSRSQGWGVERVADGLGTVLFGLVLLGNTTGFVSWQVWFTLLSLWPVLLVSAGIGLLGRAAGQSWLRGVASVPIWIAMVYAVGATWSGTALAVNPSLFPFNYIPFPFQ